MALVSGAARAAALEADSRYNASKARNIIKKEMFMKILVTLNEDGGFESAVCAHFGHCTHFLIADVKDGKIENVSTVVNKASHGGGGCLAVDEALKYGIEAVISGGMGLGAQQKLGAAGVKIFGFGGKVKDALEQVVQNKLTGIAPCAEHGHNGNEHGHDGCH